MKVSEILVGPSPMNRIGIEQFGQSEWTKTDRGKLLIALWAENVWSTVGYSISAFLGFSENNRLCISHPAFLSELKITDSTLTVDGVKEAVLAHMAAQLKILQGRNAALQLKTAELEDARDHISRAVMEAAVATKRPEAKGARLFAPYGESDLTCFVLGEGFGNKIFVTRGAGPEFSGGIVEIGMPGDEWIRLQRADQYDIFWAELAKLFAARELKTTKDDFHWLKTFVVEVNCAYHANEVVLRRRFINEQVVVSFDVDSLPKKMVQVPDDENAEV